MSRRRPAASRPRRHKADIRADTVPAEDKAALEDIADTDPAGGKAVPAEDTDPEEDKAALEEDTVCFAADTAPAVRPRSGDDRYIRDDACRRR